MIILKTSRELTCMKHAGRISQNALQIAGALVKPGVSTWEVDKAAHDYIVGEGAIPTCLGYGGFPATCCISVNDVVVHGIPSKKQILHEGDIVSIDLCATY
ncbi:MAG TPA: type I methionyl aminopeptidase, partial [Ruminococcaceae bacterium]|nr:type I methionyl aminopeptidase [Oscillospiraceae bacterium]